MKAWDENRQMNRTAEGKKVCFKHTYNEMLKNLTKFLKYIWFFLTI